LRQDGQKVPSKLSESEWERLLGLASVSARRKYYSFIFRNEMHDLNLKKKKAFKAVEREERLAARREAEAENHIIYGLGRNSIFLKIYETTMNLWNNNKLVQAMQFSPK
jgi:ribonuclease P protein 1